MELQKTFWNAMFGSFVDGDGITWQLNFNLPPVLQEKPAEPSIKTKRAPAAKPATARKTGVKRK